MHRLTAESPWPDWARPLEVGYGRVAREANHVRLIRPAARATAYCNAQLGGQDGAPRWGPPLELIVRARFSHPVEQIRGTAGFGFWNGALSPGSWQIRPPQAIWFFLGSPPYNVPLTLDGRGHGFKAMVLDAWRFPFFALLPAAPLGFLAMRIRFLYRLLWPLAQRAIRARETSLDSLDLTAFHTFHLRWERQGAQFSVDGRTVLIAPAVPRRPLPFVAWLDNSYAVATPQGNFRFGYVDAPPQWMDLAEIVLRPLSP
ncbi:MAG: hypothetical protein IRY83_11590 [Chloroflexi bacterium]|nr:hypothetical protein [Chloroflexota bacterium]